VRQIQAEEDYDDLFNACLEAAEAADVNDEAFEWDLFDASLNELGTQAAEWG